MTFAFTYDVPIDAGIYARIKDGLGPERGGACGATWSGQTPTSTTPSTCPPHELPGRRAEVPDEEL
jgi:hypothetical protein